MVEPHVFLFLGSDETEKQKRIEALQKKLFPPNLKEFNYNLVYGDDKEFSLRDLKEVFACFPTEGAKKRLVVIRAAHKLGKAFQSCMLEECCHAQGKSVIVLDVPQVKGTEAFVTACSKVGAQIVHLKNEVFTNVFDLGRAIVNHKPEQALKILAALLAAKEKAEKIMGAIFWQWERLYTDKRLKDEVYRKGLTFILDADKRLKSSSSAFARETLILETLVIKLSSLA